MGSIARPGCRLVARARAARTPSGTSGPAAFRRGRSIQKRGYRMKRMGRYALLGLTALWAAPVGAQSFGNSVTVGDGEIFVGEPTHEIRSGVVYVFRADGSGQWTQAQRLEPTDGEPGDRFGIRTALQRSEERRVGKG